MATIFQGFRIKGIDEKRVPDPKDAGTYRVGSDGINFQHYTVYLILEPIKDSDEDQAPNIDSDIREIWSEFFRELAEKWIERFETRWQEMYRGMQDVPAIGLEYCDNGEYGEIRIDETHFEEVEHLSESLRIELVAEVNRRTLNNLAEREALKEQVREINSRCFSN